MKKFLSNYKSTIILLAAIIVGAIIGIIFQEKAAVLKPLGDLFLNLLLVIIVPLIFLTITTSITKMKTPKRLGKIMVTIIGTFVVTSIIAVFVGFASTYFVKLVNPEDGEKIKQALEQDVGNDETSEEEKEDEPTIAERTVNLLTVNDFSKLLSKDNIIAVLVFSILFGVAINMAGEKGKQVKEFVQSANEVVANIVKIIMYYAPIGICCYFASMIAEYGSSLLGSYLKATIIYYIVSILYFLIFYTIYAYISDRKNGIKRFYKNIIPSLATSLSTQSSLASLPTNLATADNINITPSVSKVALPLGSTMHMEGSSMGAILKIVFLFAIFNKPFTGIDIYLISILIAVLSAVVMSGIPGGGLIGEMLIVSLYGLSNEAFVVIATIGFLIDPPATMLNVCGDISSSMLIDKCINKKEQVT